MCFTVNEGTNKSKIAFIVCVNDEQYIEECRYYIIAIHHFLFFE